MQPKPRRKTNNDEPECIALSSDEDGEGEEDGNNEQGVNGEGGTDGNKDGGKLPGDANSTADSSGGKNFFKSIPKWNFLICHIKVISVFCLMNL